MAGLERGVRPMGDWSMSMILSRYSRPSRRSWGAGSLARSHQAAGGGLEQGVDDERRLAAAGDASDAGEDAEGDAGGDVAQVVAAGADDAQGALGIGLATLGERDAAAAGEVSAGEAVGVGGDFVRGALGDDVATVDAGGRSHVDQVVGGADGVLVVLDDEDGVAEGLEAAQRGEQALVVALVQADAGLVEDVEDAGEAGADLAGEADALALAAGQGGAAAGEGEVVEADVDQELQAVGDLAQDAAGDLQALRGEGARDGGEEVEGAADGQLARLGDGAAGDADGEGLGLEAGPVADGAGLLGLVAAEFLAHPGAVGLAQAADQVGQHALERLGDLVGADAVLVGEGDGRVAGTVEDGVADVGGKLVPGGAGAGLVVAGDAVEGLVVVGGLRPGPGGDGAVGEGHALVGDDEGGVEEASPGRGRRRPGTRREGS